MGERLKVHCSSRFAWGGPGRSKPGEQGAYLIPPDSDVEFIVEILSHSISYQASIDKHGNIDPSYLCDENWLQANLRKTCGTRWYRYGDFVRAGRCYSKAAETAEKMLHASQPAAKLKEPLPPDMSPELVKQLAPHLAQVPVEESSPARFEKKWVDMFVSSLNNLAATHLQTGQSLRAREACIKALEIEPDNITTLLRAGR